MIQEKIRADNMKSQANKKDVTSFDETQDSYKMSKGRKLISMSPK